MRLDCEQWHARFAPGEYDDKPMWLDAYVETIRGLLPDMPASEALQAALRAYEFESWGNPKVAAGLYALFGPNA